MYNIAWTQKPPYGTQIDWSNPITERMLVYIPANDGAGLPQNLANQRACALNSGSLPTWNAKGMVSPLASGPIVTVQKVSYDSGSNLTVAVVFNFAALQTSAPLISALWSDNNNLLRVGDATTKDCVNSVYNGGHQVSAGIVQPTGAQCIALSLGPLVSSNLVSTMYLNGLPVNTQSFAGGSNTANSSFLWSDGNGTNGRTPSGSLVAFALWARCLTAAEIQSWGNNPWQVIKFPRMTQYYPSIAIGSLIRVPFDSLNYTADMAGGFLQAFFMAFDIALGIFGFNLLHVLACAQCIGDGA